MSSARLGEGCRPEPYSEISLSRTFGGNSARISPLVCSNRSAESREIWPGLECSGLSSKQEEEKEKRVGAE